MLKLVQKATLNNYCMLTTKENITEMSKVFSRRFGALVAYAITGSVNDCVITGNNASTDTIELHYSLVSFGSLTIQLTLDETMSLMQGIEAALLGRCAPDRVYKNAESSWRTINIDDQSSDMVNLRHGAISWAISLKEAKSILIDTTTALEFFNNESQRASTHH